MTWAARIARLAVATSICGAILAMLLLGVTPTYGGVVPGEYWIAVFVGASALLGRYAATLFSRRVIAALAGATAATAATMIVLAVKAIRWPDSPLVGDGFELLVAGYALAGALVATIGRREPLPAQAPGPLRVVAAGGWLALIATLAATALAQLGRFVGS